MILGRRSALGTAWQVGTAALHARPHYFYSSARLVSSFARTAQQAGADAGLGTSSQFARPRTPQVKMGASQALGASCLARVVTVGHGRSRRVADGTLMWLLAAMVACASAVSMYEEEDLRRYVLNRPVTARMNKEVARLERLVMQSATSLRNPDPDVVDELDYAMAGTPLSAQADNINGWLLDGQFLTALRLESLLEQTRVLRKYLRACAIRDNATKRPLPPGIQKRRSKFRHKGDPRNTRTASCLGCQ